MNRIPSARFGEPIGEALAVVAGVHRWIGDVRWWCADPGFTGLHGFGDTGDGRRYNSTAHCVYPWMVNRPARDRLTTIVLPVPATPEVIVHELGHVLDFRLGFSHEAQPISDYALTNRFEAFAEAFTAWLYYYEDQATFLQDRATVELFESLQ